MEAETATREYAANVTDTFVVVMVLLRGILIV